MKTSLLKYLSCPNCHGVLNLITNDNNNEILTGELNCLSCDKFYLILNGVPTFINSSGNGNPKVKLTAKNFAYSWQKFSRTNKDFYYKQFFDWISPINEDFLRGKLVLDAGCGKGHHLLMISPHIKEAIGIDISNSVFIAYNNTKHLPNIHIIQADLNYLPFKDEIFDYIYSIGVIHHTESPKEAVKSIYKKVKGTGQISIWVYGKENNEWITDFLDPIRKFITSYFNLGIIHVLALFLALPLFLILKLIYSPVKKIKFLIPLSKMLFYYPYLSYISSFDFTEINNIVFDHLVAPTSHYLSEIEIEDLVNFTSRKARTEWHNQNSWRIQVTK